MKNYEYVICILFAFYNVMKQSIVYMNEYHSTTIWKKYYAKTQYYF